MPASGNVQEVDLAARLVRMCTTVDGREDEPLALLAGMLEKAGFVCETDSYDPTEPKRQSLVARLCPGDDRPSLYFGGHIDTVPFGAGKWKKDPLCGEVVDGMLHGRGATDMKGGVAATVCACIAMAPKLKGRDLVLHVYGSEERGCQGSLHVSAQPKFFGHAAAGVIAEPTELVPLVGHKGALWLTLRTKGKSAHASMPDKGDNALLKLMHAVRNLPTYVPKGTHPLLGGNTAAITTLHAGINTNSIPEEAVLTVDMRTIPGQDHKAIVAEVREIVGPDVEIEVSYDAIPVWTDPDDPWCKAARERTNALAGNSPEVRAAAFFTDAASVRRAFPDMPLLVLGPGLARMCHVTDEVCPVDQIVMARKIYEALIEDWYRC
ncbi:MAG: M20 family metallopeptidase [Desulfovibrio sp.]|jgi:succinyl-diaminopimelate desuccinylase|nr:M20 family metallopeptidase [Desulfovibrio sp.]